jgi:DNA-binding MarR family transcriptional regulator
LEAASTAGNSRDDAGATRPLTEAELSGWLNFCNAHTSLTRQLDAALQAGHGISLAEHTVLQQLLLGGGHLRMSELADLVLLSPSGTSRLVDRLVAGGLIERQSCGADGRAVHAVVTDRGRGRLAEAAPTHAAALRRLFVGQFTAQEYELLAGLLLRVAPACRSRQASTP